MHRVAHGLCIEDNGREDISFTTVELAHRSQDGYDGFWGHFAPRENPTFDPKDSKSSKFLRHFHVKRADILVYNVQVFELPAPDDHPTAKLVYVATSSLRKLAAVSTAQPDIPEELPETHAAFDDATLQQPLQKNSVLVLKAALQARDLHTSGRKSDLVARLSAALGDQEGQGDREGGDDADAERDGEGEGEDLLLRPLSKNTVPQLRAALKSRNLDSSGRKADLLGRLSAALGGEGGESEEDGDSEERGSDGDDSDANGMPPCRPPSLVVCSELLVYSLELDSMHVLLMCLLRWRRR